MLFLAGENGQPIMVLMLTEMDVNDMRSGRTKFVDHKTTKGHMFNTIVLSLHKNQHEIEECLKAAGHGKLLQGMSSPVPEPQQARCQGCDGIMDASLLLESRCICCWRETARAIKGV